MQSMDKIVTYIEENSESFLCSTACDLLPALPFEKAYRFYNPDSLAEAETLHKFSLKKDADVKKKIKGYLPFAWDKANNCKGLSAARSIEHFTNWLFLLNLRFSREAYDFYAKAHLIAISQYVGFNWKKHDNNLWCNSELEPTFSAEEALTMTPSITLIPYE